MGTAFLVVRLSEHYARLGCRQRGGGNAQWSRRRVSIGVSMTVLFHESGLQVTDDWIRTDSGSFPIREVRRAWVTRRQLGRGSRLMTAGLGFGALLVLVGGVGATGWFNRNWLWILAAPVLFFAAAAIGLLDPIAIYLEKRHHELWIGTDTVAVQIWRHNRIEVHKALRAIQRARERDREQNEV